MATNTDHVVFLLGDKETCSIDKVRSECSFLDVRAMHNDLACLHCGDYFPMHLLMPIDCNMLSVICNEFRRHHRKCKKKGKSPWAIAVGKDSKHVDQGVG